MKRPSITALLKNKLSLYNILSLLIFLGVILLRIVNLSFPFGDYDEGVYIATVRSMLHGFPLIEKTYNSQFPLFLDILSWFYRIDSSIWFLRLFPVLCSLAAIISAYVIIKQKLDKTTALLIVTYLGVNSIFLTVSRTVQADMPWVGFTALSFLFLILFDKKKNFGFLILSSFFFICSILIKANPIFISVLFVYSLYLIYEYRKKSINYILPFVFVDLVILLLVVPLKDLSLLYHDSVSIRSSFLSRPFEILNQSAKILLLKHEIFLILMSLLGIVCLIKNYWGSFKRFLENRFLILTLVWIITTCFVIFIYTPFFNHHIVFFIYPSALFAAYPLSYLSNRLGKYKAFVIILFLLICIYSAFYSISDNSIVSPRLNSYDEKIATISSFVKDNTSPYDYIVTDEEIIQYLANRNTPPDLVDTSFVRISNKALTDGQIIKDTKEYNVKMVVFISGRLNTLSGYKSYLEQNYTYSSIDGATVFTRK